MVVERDKLALELFDYRTNTSGWKTELDELSKQGAGKPEKPVSSELMADFKELKKLHRSSENIPYQKLLEVYSKLKDEVVQKPSSAKDLGTLKTDFGKLVREARLNLEHRFSQLHVDVLQQFPEDYGRIGPTRMANFSFVHREYCVKRFGLDIEYFWVRLLKIVRNDATFYPMLEEAKNQLDFSVAFTTVLALTTLVWIQGSLAAAGWLPFLLVCILGPIATLIAYQVALQSYRGFTEVVRSAVALYRFDLLGLLHIDLPADSDAEKDLWKDIATGEKKITYKHTVQSAPGAATP